MDVTHPIRAAIPSLDGVVLEVLDRSTQAQTLTTIHRLCATGSLAGVRRVLLRLVGSGLALQVPGGYVLNREHLAAPAVHLLAGMRSELIRRIRTSVAAWAVQPDVVAAFGSFARRDGDEHSDIDMLVIGPRQLAKHCTELVTAIQLWTGNNCQVVHRTAADFHRLVKAGEPIVRHWQDDALIIVGDRDNLAGGNRRRLRSEDGRTSEGAAGVER